MPETFFEGIRAHMTIDELDALRKAREQEGEP